MPSTSSSSSLSTPSPSPMPMPSPAAAAAAAANAVNALLARGSPSEVSHPDVFPVLLGNALDRFDPALFVYSGLMKEIVGERDK